MYDWILLAENLIEKGKKYVRIGQSPPKGAIIHQGNRGGKYYLTEDRHMVFNGQHHELIRSVGVRRDQWEELKQKFSEQGAKGVEFIPKPEYGKREGDDTPLYNMYVNWGDSTQEKIKAKLAADKEKYGKRKKQEKPPDAPKVDNIPSNQFSEEEIKSNWIGLGTSNKVGRARNLAKERGVPMSRIHEIYKEAEGEATIRYLENRAKLGDEISSNMLIMLQARAAMYAKKLTVDKVNAEQPPAVEEGSVSAFLLTGNTYPLKSDIKYQFGGKWDRDQKGWMVHGKHADAVKKFAEEHGLDLEETETEGSTFRHLTTEERRVIRTERNQRKAERIKGWAEKNQKEGESKWNEGSGMMDQIPLGQPILVGHYSEKRDRNYRERAWNKMQSGYELKQKATEQFRRAEKLSQPARMAGDTDKARKTQFEYIKEKAMKEFIPGKTQVQNLLYQSVGTVIKHGDKSVLVYNPKTKQSESWKLTGIRMIDHEGSVPKKEDLVKEIQPTKTISKQEWDRTYHEDKKLDQYTRIRYIMEGSMAHGRGWVPVTVV